MNLQSYVARGDIASLEPGQIAGLVPYLIGRHPSDELIGIGLKDGLPVALNTTALQPLSDSEGYCAGIAGWWRSTGADALWLIGFAADPADVPEAVVGLLEPLGAVGLDDLSRQLMVFPDRRTWGYVSDHVHSVDTDALAPVAAIDPAYGRLGALAFHAACTQHREAAQLAPLRTRAERDHASQAQRLLSDLRRLAASTSDLTEADRKMLNKAVHAEDYPSDTTAAYLGIALADNPSLVDTAVQVIWSAENSLGAQMGLWCQIARLTVGTPRAVAAGLAALAAWRGEDPLAASALRTALRADAACPVALAAAAIIGTGTPAAYLDCIDTLNPKAEPNSRTAIPLREEVA